jgi:uncharacterized membrane protein
MPSHHFVKATFKVKIVNRCVFAKILPKKVNDILLQWLLIMARNKKVKRILLPCNQIAFAGRDARGG